MLKFCYRERCIERRGIVLKEEKRREPVHCHEWNSLSEDGEVAGTAGEFEGGERLEIAIEG